MSEYYFYIERYEDLGDGKWQLSFVTGNAAGDLDAPPMEELQDLLRPYYGDSVEGYGDPWEIGAAENWHICMLDSEAACKQRATEITFILEKAGFDNKHGWGEVDEAPLAQAPAVLKPTKPRPFKP